MICDICGVKVTTSAARRERFGHIELASAVPHPFGSAGERLSVVPVMPTVFVQSAGGRPLADLYEELLQPATTEFGGRATVVERLFTLLLPVATLALEWELAERITFIHGLALERREARVEES
jgi:hypothetical protein